MFETITTLMRSVSAQGRENLIDANAVILLEQKIRDIAAQHDNSKRTLAGLMAQVKSLKRSQASLQISTDDLEDRARQALTAGRDKLANQAAQAIADNENELFLKAKAIENLENEVERLRALVERTNRRLVELRQGLVVARHTEFARKSRVGTLKSLNNGQQSVEDAQEMLERILNRSETEEALAQYTTLNEELSGKAIVDQLDQAGFGTPLKVRTDAVLERLKSNSQETKKRKSK